MVNRLIIAAAGSGKTTYLVRQAMQQSDSVLITTYTIANELEIRKKIVELNGFVPHNVTIQTWYSFLLQHGVRPFQGVVLDDKINGMILVNEKSGKKYDGKYGPVYFAEDDYRKFYFTDGMKMYSDKIAKFVCRCEKETKGRVSQRISRIYPKIYVDEIQDLAGYDLDIIKSLLQAECDVTMVGDPRQVTYHTHNEAKYKKYANGKIEEFIKTECKKPGCIIDKETLNDSYRNNQSICSYSSQLYEEYGETGTKQFAVTGHDGVFLVRPDDVDAYLEEYKGKVYWITGGIGDGPIIDDTKAEVISSDGTTSKVVLEEYDGISNTKMEEITLTVKYENDQYMITDYDVVDKF